MFGSSSSPRMGGLVTGLRNTLADLDQHVEQSVRIDRIRQLEELRSAVAAAQARETAAFVMQERAAQRAQGATADRIGRGIAAQVALARRMSPHAAARYVGQAVVMTRELPETFEQLRRGQVSEYRATLVAQHTAWLSSEHRAAVDAEIAAHLSQLSNRKVEDLTKKIAYRLDPHGLVAHLRRAENERYVSVRPAPDYMAYLTTLTTMKQAVAAYAELHRHAQTAVGVGPETRSRGQIMADTMIERITGQTNAQAVPVTVNLIMTDQPLFSYGKDADEPAHLVGGGTIPADLARRIVGEAGDADVFVRRLYTHPTTGQLAAMDTTSRLFTENQRLFLTLRDQTCRTPWCDAPIRHADHVTTAEDGGPTSTANGQGLCVACNHAKQAPGWRQEVDGDDVVTSTPTGHRYRSRPPDPPGCSPPSTAMHRLRRVRAGRAA